MQNLKKMHERHIEKDQTEFGLPITKENMGNYFNNDPQNSKMTINFEMFENDDDIYSSEYINSHSVKIRMCTFEDLANNLEKYNYGQKSYD